MWSKNRCLFLGVLALSLVGCSSGNGDTNGAGGTSAGGTAAGGSSSGGTATAGGSGNTCTPSFKATTESNYTFSSTFTLPMVTVQPDTELTFDWSAVDHDFLKHPLNPASDIDTANLVLWALDEAKLQEKLNADSLKQLDAVVPASSPTNKTLTSVSLFDFQSAAGEVLTKEQILPYMSATAYPPASHTYTLIAATGSLISGGQARIIQAFKLDPASTNTKVVLTNDSTKLDYQVDLDALKPIMLPAGQADVTVDWADILTNALGQTFVPTQITEVRVAHYNETISELEAQFLDLELIDEDTWRNEDLAGTSVSLSTLKDDAGQAFPGVSADGTWVLALVCGACRNPAPWYLTLLKPCQ